MTMHDLILWGVLIVFSAWCSYVWYEDNKKRGIMEISDIIFAIFCVAILILAIFAAGTCK
jgi:maltodextrin utilization protein YvdJ